jgi:F0F1-type ATP synthase, subunit b
MTQAAEIARTFGVDWPHLTAQMISFAIVCAMLYWLAYQPVLRMLEERRKQIAMGVANTEKINAALAGIEAQRQGVMADAHAQGQKFLADAREAANACRSRRRSGRLRPPSRSWPRRAKVPPPSMRAC